MSEREIVACPYCGKPAGQNDLRPAGEMICHHCGDEWLTEECAKRYADAADEDWKRRLAEQNKPSPELATLRKLRDAAVKWLDAEVTPGWRDRAKEMENPNVSDIKRAFYKALLASEREGG